MVSNISFGSFFNPERLNSHQSLFGKLDTQEKLDAFKASLNENVLLAENNISKASEDGVNVTKLFTQEEIRKILKKVKVPLDG